MLASLVGKDSIIQPKEDLHKIITTFSLASIEFLSVLLLEYIYIDETVVSCQTMNLTRPLNFSAALLVLTFKY